MNIFLISMVLLSLITAWIMASNMNRDESKERFKLTQDYKRIKKESYHYDRDSGQKFYTLLCAKCHNQMGAGTLQAPPLKGSDLVINDAVNTAKIIVHGLKGEIMRNNRKFNAQMPGFRAIAHHDLAHVLNYIRIEFNGLKSVVHPVEIVKAKIDTLTKKGAIDAKSLHK